MIFNFTNFKQQRIVSGKVYWSLAKEKQCNKFSNWLRLVASISLGNAIVTQNNRHTHLIEIDSFALAHNYTRFVR